jgi:hypothetical protein
MRGRDSVRYKNFCTFIWAVSKLAYRCSDNFYEKESCIYMFILAYRPFSAPPYFCRVRRL